MATIPIIVIGASAGGVEAVSRIVRDLAPGFPGAVFVTLHFPVSSTSVFPQILARAGHLPASHPEDGEAIAAGRIYVAPPDRHLLIHRDAMQVVQGPKQKGNRPAVDPMFRSAAVFHGPRVAGVVLTGNLDDGSAGLLSIKQHGGVCIVQDPTDALFPSMPKSAIALVAPHFVLPVQRIGPKLMELAPQLSAGRGEHDETLTSEPIGG